MHGSELGANKILRQIVKLLFAECFAAEAKLQNGDAGGVIFYDGWRCGAGRKYAYDSARQSADLGDGHFHFRARMEVDTNDACAGDRLGLDVFDIVNRGGEASLKAGGDALGHFVSRDAGVAPDNIDYGDVDFRKDIDGHLQRCQGAENGDEHRHDDKGVRTVKC